MATRRAVREGPRSNVPAERIDHSNGKKKIDFRDGEGRGGSLQRQRELLAWCQGLGSLTGSGLLIQRCSLLFIYPGGGRVFGFSA